MIAKENIKDSTLDDSSFHNLIYRNRPEHTD